MGIRTTFKQIKRNSRIFLKIQVKENVIFVVWSYYNHCENAFCSWYCDLATCYLFCIIFLACAALPFIYFLLAFSIHFHFQRYFSSIHGKRERDRNKKREWRLPMKNACKLSWLDYGIFWPFHTVINIH